MPAVNRVNGEKCRQTVTFIAFHHLVNFVGKQCIHYHRLIHDMCAKVEFQIQILHSCQS